MKKCKTKLSIQSIKIEKVENPQNVKGGYKKLRPPGGQGDW